MAWRAWLREGMVFELLCLNGAIISYSLVNTNIYTTLSIDAVVVVRLPSPRWYTRIHSEVSHNHKPPQAAPVPADRRRAIPPN